MYPFIRCCDMKKIDFAKTIKNPAKMEKLGPRYMKRPVLKGIKFLIDPKFYPTMLRFPPEATDTKAKQVQKFNYDRFIHVMAEMVQKYAPEILG